jgi:tetratricopeptide (TPR) repeat protein
LLQIVEPHERPTMSRINSRNVEPGSRYAGPVADLIRVLARNFQRALARGDEAEAEAVLGEMESRAPLAVETRGCRLELLVRMRRDHEAEQVCGLLLGQFPHSARIQYLAGTLRYKRREYAQAERHFAESEQLASSAFTRRWLGRTLTQLGRFDEADAVLGRLSEQGHDVLLDRAWLCERRSDFQRALELVEAHLAHHPGDRFAERQRERLRARRLTPEEVIEEMDALIALGESVPDAVLPDYVRALLEAGRKDDVRRLLETLEVSPALAGSLAWACHQTFAYDLAFDLFALGLPANTSYNKYLVAFEKTAERSGRTDDLARIYEQHSERDRRFFGRMKRLRRPSSEG